VTRRSRSSAWRRHSLPERATNALLAAGACVVGLAWLYVAAFGIGATESADQRVYDGFVSLGTPTARARAWSATELFNLRPYAVAVLIVLAAAVWMRRARVVAAAAVILLGANVTTQLLKVLTEAPRHPAWMLDTGWPSGHVTAATSLALCVVLIAPAVLRPYAVAAAALGVLTVAYSILVVGSHRPSDVLAGMLMAGAWTGLVVAALELAERRRPSGRAGGVGARARTLWLAAGAAAFAVAALLVLVTAVAPVGPVGPYLSNHTTFFAGAVLLAASGAALPAAAATLLDRPLNEHAPG
jgi:membrane-associated phospholipid phosphatase